MKKKIFKYFYYGLLTAVLFILVTSRVTFINKAFSDFILEHTKDDVVDVSSVRFTVSPKDWVNTPEISSIGHRKYHDLSISFEVSNAKRNVFAQWSSAVASKEWLGEIRRYNINGQSVRGVHVIRPLKGPGAVRVYELNREKTETTEIFIKPDVMIRASMLTDGNLKVKEGIVTSFLERNVSIR